MAENVFLFRVWHTDQVPSQSKKKGFQLPLAPSKRDAFEELFTPGSGGTCGWALISFISGVGHA